MICNKILRQGIPPLKNRNETIERKLTCQWRMTIAQPPKTANRNNRSNNLQSWRTTNQWTTMKRSNCNCRTTTLQSWIKQVQESWNEPVNTHQPLNQWCWWRTIQHNFTVNNTIKKMEQNSIATHTYNKHLRLLNLIGKHLRLSEPSKDVALWKNLRKNARGRPVLSKQTRIKKKYHIVIC